MSHFRVAETNRLWMRPCRCCFECSQASCCHNLTQSFFLLQHWIRIELNPDLLIQRLTMTVDPSDSSYMPSVVVLSAGDSIQTLKEIKTVHISATDSVVTLMEDAPEVRPCKVLFFILPLTFSYPDRCCMLIQV